MIHKADRPVRVDAEVAAAAAEVRAAVASAADPPDPGPLWKTQKATSRTRFAPALDELALDEWAVQAFCAPPNLDSV